MKKFAICFIVVFSSLVQAQEKSSTGLFGKKHEIKLGAIKMLAGPIFEGTYEYIYSKDFTFGSSILLNLQKNNSYPEDFSLTPFARFYFQETQEYGAKGFLVEGFAKYVTGKYDKSNFNGSYYYNPQSFSSGAIGLSLGKKWINNSGFVFELLAGVGRTLGNSSVAPDVFFRGDLNIGYRF